MKLFRQRFVFTWIMAALAGLVALPAGAIVVSPTQDTTTLVNALLGGGGTGIVVTGVTLNGHHQTLAFGLDAQAQITSSGTYTNASGTYGIGSGIVLSTGGVAGLLVSGIAEPVIPGYGDGISTVENNTWAYGTTYPPAPDATGTPATPAQEALLDPITSRPDLDPPETYDHFDVTELIIDFDMQPGFDQVAFNVVFGTEEYVEWVDSPYIDGFGMFLNGANIAFVDGAPVNVRHPGMTALAGTELDGVLAPGGNPVLTFAGSVDPTGNTLRFIVADTSDGAYDATVYFSSLEGVPPIPLPPAAWLAITAVAACLPRLRRRLA